MQTFFKECVTYFKTCAKKHVQVLIELQIIRGKNMSSHQNMFFFRFFKSVPQYSQAENRLQTNLIKPGKPQPAIITAEHPHQSSFAQQLLRVSGLRNTAHTRAKKKVYCQPLRPVEKEVFPLSNGLRRTAHKHANEKAFCRPLRTVDNDVFPLLSDLRSISHKHANEKVCC